MKNTLAQIPHYGISISLIDLLIALALAVALGMAVVFVYQYTHRGLSYEKAFTITLLMMAPIVTVVMMLIGSNLALSLGMVGALSIIRFRTVIKDSRDMIYLFWAIAVGLGCGTSNWLVITLASLFIGGLLSVLHLLQYGRTTHSDYVLVISGKAAAPESIIRDKVKNISAVAQLRSLDMTDQGWEMVFEIRLIRGKEMNGGKIVQDLKDLGGVEKVSLLAPQLALPV